MPFKHQLAIAVRAKVAICFGLAQRFLLFHLRRRFHQEGAQFPQHIQRYMSVKGSAEGVIKAAKTSSATTACRL